MTVDAQTADVMEIWVVNASPFIGLAKIGRLGLLTGGGHTSCLPETVAREIGAGPARDAATEALADAARWGVTVLPLAAPDPRLAAFTLDAGEAAVLTEALGREDCLCVIDDGPGRAAARALGLDVTGTVGVLLQARREGRTAALAPDLRALRAAGLYLPREDLLRGLLAGFGEAWP